MVKHVSQGHGMIHDYVGRLSGTPTWSFRETSDEERINDSEVGLHFMEASRSDLDPIGWNAGFMTAQTAQV